jgi:hypothetical protein
MARLYNKTTERKKRHDESYGVLLQEHTSALGIPTILISMCGDWSSSSIARR